MSVVQGGNGLPGSFLVIAHGSRSKLLDGDEYANSIANFLNPHFFQNRLITFDEIASVHVVGFCITTISLCNGFAAKQITGNPMIRELLTFEELFVLSAVDFAKPFSDAFLIPRSTNTESATLGICLRFLSW